MIETGSLVMELAPSIHGGIDKFRSTKQKTLYGWSYSSHTASSAHDIDVASRGRKARAAEPAALEQTVLFVSRDDYFRSMMRAYLEHVGFRVVSCADAARAAEIFLRRPGADLLLFDLHGLGDSSLSLADDVTVRAPEIPVIVISGPSSDPVALNTIAGRGWHSIAKPLLLPDLLALIHSALNTPPAARAGGRWWGSRPSPAGSPHAGRSGRAEGLPQPRFEELRNSATSLKLPGAVQ